MKVLVTGGAGYIGSHAAKALAAAGHEPVALDNLSTGDARNVRWGPLVEGSIDDAELVRRVLAEHQPGAVMHFAASAYVGESMHDPAKYFRNNVIGSLSLLESIIADGVRPFVFSSSCATYGVPQADEPIDEEHPQRPVNPYGETKLMVEQALRWYGELCGLPWASLRYFNAAGADPDGELGEAHEPETHLIPLVIRAGLEHGSVSIFGSDYPTPDGTAVRDYVHVSDLAEAHVRALTRLEERPDGLALNLGTGVGHSVRQLVDAVQDELDVPIEARPGPRRDGDPPVLVAAGRRAQETLGWTPTHSAIEEIVATAVAWHAERNRVGAAT